MLGISRDARLLFVELCCLATAHGDGTGTTKHTQEQAMTALRIHHKTFKAALITLQSIGVCNVNDSGVIILTNWEKRQFSSDSSAKRTQKYRENNKAVTSQKRHGDALDTDTDTEKKETPLPPCGDVSSEEPVEQVSAECIPVASPAIADSATTVAAPAKPSESEPDTFAEFWATYPHHPHRRSRKSALVAYRARLKAGRTPDELLAAARKMADDVRAKGDDRQYIPAAERWLSSGKWEGWLAPVAQPPVAQPSVDQMAPDVRRRYEALLQAGVAAEMATA
jgi:hypothetical protein